MAQRRKPPQTNEDCPILRAANTIVVPRVECAVFGCRISGRDRDPIAFHPLPREPDRLSQWLLLINRQDLAEKAHSSQKAVVCALHFPPGLSQDGRLADDAIPSLLLPATRHEFVYEGSLEESAVQVKDEPVEEDYTIEIEFEPENPSPSTISEEIPQSSLKDERTNLPTTDIETTNRNSVAGPTSIQQISPFIVPVITNQISVVPRLISQFVPAEEDIPETKPISIKTEPQYFDYQMNSETQTDRMEAFVKRATFSVIESVNIPPKRLPSVASQTTPELVEVFTKDLRATLGKELDAAKKKLNEAENPSMEKKQFLKGCDMYLDEKIATFVKAHAYLSNKFTGKNYPVEFKNFALKLYLLNPKSYNFVKQFFDLPSKETIQKFKMPLRSGIHPDLMASLKVKIEQLSSVGRISVVCFEVMALSKGLYYDISHDYLCGMEEIDGVAGDKQAEYAAVIAVRGIYARWKQPVSFALIADKSKKFELQAWLHKTIQELFDIGLNVKALVKKPNEEFLEPIKGHYLVINGRKIYNIIDFPDLLKAARDELMQYNFYIEGSVVKWEHILSVYDSDNSQELSLIPNVTDKHVRPDGSTKDNVKFAMQLFSSNIAAAMHNHVIARMENKRATDTVKFMTKIKDLFDILYSRKLENAYRATAIQKRYLKDTIEYLQRLLVKDNWRNVESYFASQLIFTIKSMMYLMTDLNKSNVSFLLTKNLSKDFMLSYFDEIRRLNGNSPTPIKFVRSFRKLSLINLLSNTKKTATSEELMTTLLKVNEYVTEDIEKEEKTESNIKLAVGVTDYKIDWPSNEYISNYLLWKCLEKHNCAKCAKVRDEYKFYNPKNVTRLTIKPPTRLTEFVILLGVKFNMYFNKTGKDNMNFGLNFYSIIEEDSFKMPCNCFPIQYFKMLYIRLKIFSAVKKFNLINKNKQ